MAKHFSIVHYPVPVLRRKTKYIKSFGPSLVKLGEQMHKFMGRSSGIGLAAPQVGLSKKLIVVDVGEEYEPLMLANPKVVWESGDREKFVEGCLSLPGVEGPVIRPTQVRVTAQTLERGDEIEIEADGLLARCLQHEIDHLNAILFVDRLAPKHRHEIEPILQDLERAVA